MAMEAAAVDELMEKGKLAPDVALAVAKAVDITIKSANLVTVSMLDARFAASDAKLEARFGAVEARFASIEKSIVSTKVWAVGLYAGLVIALFGALALDHHWLVNREDQREDQLIARFEAMQARSDQRLQQLEARSDQRFQQIDARFQQVDARLQKLEVRLDGLEVQVEQIRALLTPVVRGQPVATQKPPARSPSK